MTYCTPSGKRTFTVVFPDGRQKKTVSPYSINVAVICPYKKSFRVCDWFRTVAEAKQYIQSHPAIKDARVTPVKNHY
mgnify:CR=1 FL=1|tara:strand:- start:276 stop:506 length:231 start_codon:yes stop_codon:yes gene_type:complete